MFNIGDKIVYPMHGAGIIESIEEKEVLSQKKKYYIMRIPLDDIKVMIPMDSIDDFKIRSVISYGEFLDHIEKLKQSEGSPQEGWNKRYRSNMEKIKRGEVHGMMEVVRDLEVREAKKGLSPGEKKILETAKQILYSELMLVTGLRYDEVDSIIKDAISYHVC